MRALKYYLSSLPTLLRIKNFWLLPLIFFKKPLTISLDNGLKYFIETPMDVWVIKEIILDRQYERVKCITKGENVIDIGAAFGDFTVYASKKGAKVIAYDPDKRRIDLLEKNITLNKCQDITVKAEAAESLDRVFGDNKLKRCDFLKIDCEGCEYRLIENASRDTLTKIKHIVFEIHLFNKSMRMNYLSLKKKLIENDYTLQEFPNQVHGHLKFLFATRN